MLNNICFSAKFKVLIRTVKAISCNKSFWKLLCFQIPWCGRLMALVFLIYVTLLLCKHLWLPVCFSVQFKMLVVTVKALHGLRPWLHIVLSPTVSTHYTWFGRIGVLWVTLAKEFWLAEPRKMNFSVMMPNLWHIIPFEVTSTRTLLAFCCVMKCNWKLYYYFAINLLSHLC